MSPVNKWAKSNAPFGVVGSLASTPSISTFTWFEFVPRIKTEVWPPGPPVCTTLRPGTALSASGTVRYCWRSMSADVITVIELATSLSGVGIVVGLTTMVGKTCVLWGLSCALAVCRHAARALVAPSNRTYRPMPHVPSFAFAGANASGEDEGRREGHGEIQTQTSRWPHVRNVVGDFSLTAFAPALPSPLRKTAPYGRPVHRLGDRAGRSPGSRVVTSMVRPSQFPSGRLGPEARRSQLRGQPRILRSQVLEFLVPVFPLSSPE